VPNVLSVLLVLLVMVANNATTESIVVAVTMSNNVSNAQQDTPVKQNVVDRAYHVFPASTRTKKES
jgi:hypothetical protein